MPDTPTTHEVSLQDGYARWAAQYDQEENALITVEEQLTLPLLAGIPITHVLDLGTGTGRYALRCAAQARRVVALDQSAAMLAVAEAAAAKAAAKAAPRLSAAIEFRQFNLAQDLPSPPDSFDLVLAALVLCHVENLAHVASEAYRVLRPGGHILVTDFHPTAIAAGWRTQFTSAGDIYLLPTCQHTQADYLNALSEAGFRIQTVQEALVRDAPPGAFSAELLAQDGDKPLCLVILASKPGGA